MENLASRQRAEKYHFCHAPGAASITDAGLMRAMEGRRCAMRAVSGRMH